MEVPSREEYLALCRTVEELQIQIMDLQAGQSKWVTLKEAAQLAGRSESWFEKRNRTDKFPIATQPRATDSGRVFFSRADCIAFARKNAILPPASVAYATSQQH